MTGRHRSTASRPTLVLRRERLVEVVDAHTDMAHLLTYDALAAGRRGRGRYIAVCGVVAPRGASLYPQRSWEELGGRFLGLMAYLDSKDEGDNSMVRHEAP